MDLKHLDIEKVATAIETDAGQPLDGLRLSLEQAKNGVYGRIHTPETIKARRGRPVGSVKHETRKAVSLRLDAATLEKLRASGKGWQSRAAAVLAEYAATALKTKHPKEIRG